MESNKFSFTKNGRRKINYIAPRRNRKKKIIKYIAMHYTDIIPT